MPIDSKRVQAVFLAAVEQADRAAILDRECGDDLELRRRVEALLKANDEPASYLDQPPFEFAKPLGTVDYAPITEKPGSMIGPYKLKEQIGEGGFGLVFVAEQQEPVKRKVALKVIKPGMDTREIMTRFTAERQALALMDHPNIARVLDAGATDSGRPYFVMELVRGIPITDYCDQNQLAPCDRLDLFVTVCQAVQHAHQKGIIHRDIKPSNVLVTSHDGKPVAKVIDFGVAKAIHQQLTERSIYTNFAQMIGTPLYMSPEQAEMSGLDIDTRSDIYSLGVLLYELLTGTTPLEKKRFAKAAYDEIRRMIRDEEPPKPSTRLSASDSSASIAAQRHMDPARLSKLMRGDLDWITMKALEKDRSRRYETASGFALDIQRHLAGEAVLAAPPSAAYRLRKFAHKHRAALTTATGIALLLVAGVAVSVWQAVRATTAEQTAKVSEELALDQKRQADDAKKQAEKRRDELAMLNENLRRANYVADMNLAQHAWETNNIVRTRQLLDQHLPKPNEFDLRGFEWHYFDRLFHGDRWSVKAHAGFVTSVALTPDGKRLYSFGKTSLPQAATLTKDLPGEVKLWDTATGRQLPMLLQMPTEKMRRIAVSRDGKHLAASCWDQGFRVWDLATGRSIDLDVPAKEGAYDLGFSPDGKRLVTMSLADAAIDEDPDSTVRIWDLASRKATVTLEKFQGLIRVPDFSPDGKYLAIPSYLNGVVRVVEAETGREAFTCKSRDGFLAHVTFSPDSKSLAACRQQGAIIWDVATHEERATLHSPTHLGVVLAYSPDGKRLAMGTLEGLIELWDVGTGQILHTFKGHGGEIRMVVFSPDSTFLVSAGADGTVRVWDNTERQDTLPVFEGAARLGHMDFSPDGQSLLVENLDEERWHLVDVASGKRRGGPIEIDEKNDHCFDWSADGKLLIFPSPRKTIAIHDTATGACIRTFSLDHESTCSTAFTPDGHWFALSGPAGPIKILNAQTGEERCSIHHGLTDPVHNLAISSDGSHLAGADMKGRVKVWETTSGRETTSVQVSDIYMVAIRFSSNGKLLALVGNNLVLRSGEARIVDIDARREIMQLRGHAIVVNDVAFHPDGQRVATCSADGTIRIWDIPTGQEILTLKGSADAIGSIRFLAGGRQLISASRDGTVRIWDATPLPE